MFNCRLLKLDNSRNVGISNEAHEYTKLKQEDLMPKSDKPKEGELILYQTPEGTVRVEVLYEDETFWLNQKRIAELFGVEIPTINYHLNEIYESGELRPEATIRRILRVQTEGSREVRREIEFYNLDAIISVGCRVNSAQATRFRIWATQTLREFVIKYLDYAENQAARQTPMRMADWVGKLDAFLKFNEYEVLTNAGKVSAEVAKRLAEEQYEKFRVSQDRAFESDFEREVKRISAASKSAKPKEK